MYLITGSGDGSVRLWEPESGKLLDTYVASLPIVETVQIPGQGGADAAEAEGVAATAEGEEAGGEGGSESGDGEGASGGEEEGGGGGGGGGGGDDEDGGDRVEKGPRCAPVLDICCSPDG